MNMRTYTHIFTHLRMHTSHTHIRTLHSNSQNVRHTCPRCNQCVGTFISWKNTCNSTPRYDTPIHPHTIHPCTHTGIPVHPYTSHRVTHLYPYTHMTINASIHPPTYIPCTHTRTHAHVYRKPVHLFPNPHSHTYTHARTHALIHTHTRIHLVRTTPNSVDADEDAKKDVVGGGETKRFPLFYEC